MKTVSLDNQFLDNNFNSQFPQCRKGLLDNQLRQFCLNNLTYNINHTVPTLITFSCISEECNRKILNSDTEAIKQYLVIYKYILRGNLCNICAAFLTAEINNFGERILISRHFTCAIDRRNKLNG
jgi:hypothetical protein